MESIRTDGVLQPILVRPMGDDYEVVEGHHRFEASKLVGCETIPCYIREMTDREVLIVQLKAQAVRPRDTRPFEYARRLKKLTEEGFTIRDLSNMVDKQPDWVRNMLRLNRLCHAAANRVLSGDITVSKAIHLAKLPEHLQPTFIDDAIKMKAQPFSRRVTEAKRDYDAFLLKDRQGSLEEGFSPRIRSVKDIMKESETFEAAGKVLTSCNANTPEMGWKACLAWLMRIDPVTVRDKKAGIKEQYHAYLTDYQLRLKTREMIENLTFDTISYEPDGESHE
jgi:hypothetical protein